MTGGRVFFDTNVLLYMYGGTDVDKRTRAKELFRQYAGSGLMLLSTQIVQEFYAAGSRKLGMARRELRSVTMALMDCPLVTVDGSHIASAMQSSEQYKISFWDALVIAAAESGGAQVLYTEDLNDGQRYGTVTVKNPFRPQNGTS